MSYGHSIPPKRDTDVLIDSQKVFETHGVPVEHVFIPMTFAIGLLM